MTNCKADKINIACSKHNYDLRCMDLSKFSVYYSGFGKSTSFFMDVMLCLYPKDLQIMINIIYAVIDIDKSYDFS